MKLDLTLKAPAAGRRHAGWTLPEMLISVGVGTLMLASVAVVYIFMNRSLDATANYEELDRQSRNALDVITSDIRETGHLTNYTTNALYFTNLDGSALTYRWDTSNLLTYTNASTQLAGCPRGGTLLKNCNALKFTVFQRNPSNGTTMTFWPLTTNNRKHKKKSDLEECLMLVRCIESE